MSFVQGCRDRVDACNMAVAQKIDDEFAATCCRLGKAQGDERLRRVLRAAAALGRGPQLEAFFGERVLDAFVRATYTRGRLDGVERGSRSGLPTMYRATLEFVEERCGAALRACEVAARGVDDDVLGLGCPRRRRARGAAARSEATAARVFIRRRFIVRGRLAPRLRCFIRDAGAVRAL